MVILAIFNMLILLVLLNHTILVITLATHATNQVAFVRVLLTLQARAEGSATLNFWQHNSGIFGILAWFQNSWIDSCDSCLPNKACDSYYTEKYKIFKDIMIPHSWFPDSSSESKWFIEPLIWFRTVADPWIK